MKADIKVVTLNEEQWNDVLAPPDDEVLERPTAEVKDDADDDLFTYRGEEGKPGPKDWTGPERDKRLAFLLLRFFWSENVAQR